MPFYLQSATSQGACPNSLLFNWFHLRFTFEFIKERGSVSKKVGQALVGFPIVFAGNQGGFSCLITS
jgi:hypothetical protein